MEINTTRLRCTLGWLGILLPWIVAILLGEIPQSISATYYTYEAGPVFMIVLGSASFLLFSYKGYDKQDDIVNSLAGLFGIGVCLFPCRNNLPALGTFQVPPAVSAICHNTSAVMFFLLLAYNSLFLFTKHGSVVTENKKKRNMIYKLCGVGMVLSFTVMLFPWFPIRTWLIETIALFFFGISFLTKADYYPWLFADPK